jgi:dihydrofolate reductase
MSDYPENKPKICITAAISRKDRALGKNGKLLWHIPEDLKRFKELTLGHPVIMGRKTFDSIVSMIGKPLPNRTNIVVTRQNLCIDGALVFNSLEKAIEAAKAIDDEEVHIGGGAEIYAQALPYTDRLYLTLIDAEKEADTFFPDYSDFTKVTDKEKGDHEGLLYEFVTLERAR